MLHMILRFELLTSVSLTKYGTRDLSIIHDIGISEESINRFAKLLMSVNGERPAGHRHSVNTVAEKLLEAIANATRHFSELAMKEIDAVAGQREFADAGGQRFCCLRQIL